MFKGNKNTTKRENNIMDGTFFKYYLSNNLITLKRVK